MPVGSALRVFGIAAADGGPSNVLAQGTELVTFRDIGAVVKNAPYARAEADIDHAEHRRVIETVFQHSAIVPAPLGLVMRSKDTLVRWLEIHYVTLSEALAFIEGRAAARVHVKYADLAAIVPGETAEAAADIDAIAAGSFRLLRRHAVASVGVKSRGEPGLSASASFLVDRDKWDAFAEVVREEDKRASDLEFELTGPWPPYDFVRMQITG